MINNRFLLKTTARTRSGGFTLVELLVVIGIIAILAGVALGPITNGIKQAKHNAALQQVRQIGQLCFAFSTDNGNYPAGGTTSSGVTIADQLINANYVTDPSVFVVSSQSGTTAGSVSDGVSANLSSNNVSYSFTISATAGTGITSNASDLIPLVYFNNGPGSGVTTAIHATGSSAISVTYGSAAPFGTDGAAIFYKGNNAVYTKAGLSGTIGQVANFVSANCTDTTSYSVAQ
jgi:prepilin-type N-terminal cleavage/methylation domain-containing protein